MLRILLIILLFLNLRIKAAPISELVNPPPPSSTLATFTSTRSVYTIVWSCVVTTFLCSWVTIHPNVLPYDYERKRQPGCWDRAGQRLLLMLLTVIFPEAMIAMAWRERQTAKQVKKEFKKNGFDISMTHAYFIVMKGFALCLPEERVREIDAKAREGDEKAGSATTTNKTAKESKLLVDDDLGDARFFKTLTPEDFLERLNNSSIKLQIITKRDLQDRSKGDRMTKFITTVQALWFVVQCIVRCKEGLAITELELTTLALAILGALMMFLWRDKPQCVGVQIPVYLLKAEPEECEENERMLEAGRLREREEGRGDAAERANVLADFTEELGQSVAFIMGEHDRGLF